MPSEAKGNLIIGQSGGPTAVINASLAGVLAEAAQWPQVGQVLGMVNGIEGLLAGQLVDLTGASLARLAALRRTPAALLGSCRYKLQPGDHERILAVLARHNVRYFLYAGGNDSMDTCVHVARLAQENGYDLAVVGIPKTMDNDLACTDHCPGYGSAARFMALAARDTGLDQQALRTFVPVLITEAMGRHAGWTAAASVLARAHEEDAPHLVYVPERVFAEDRFLADVERCFRKHGWVSVVVGEGIADASGELLGARDAPADAHGHKALPLGSGVGQQLARLVQRATGLLTRVNRPGSLARSLACAVSGVDRQEAEMVGRAAVARALAASDPREVACMITLERAPEVPRSVGGQPYRCTMGAAPLAEVANAEKLLPPEMVNAEGNGLTEAFRAYALPLIGRLPPPAARLGWFRPVAAA